MDNHKIIYSKRVYPFNLSNIFTLSQVNSETLTTIDNIDNGTYYYAISLYNTNTGLETFTNNDPDDNSTTITITSAVSGLNYVYISNLAPIYDSSYNAYKIYRSCKLIEPVNNKKLYLITTIPSSINEYYDYSSDINIINNPLKSNEYVITDDIFPEFVNRPGTKPILVSNNATNYFNVLYVYVITYTWIDTNNIYTSYTYENNIFNENPNNGSFSTVPSDQASINNNTSIPNRITINLPISPDSRVIGRAIYKSGPLPLNTQLPISNDLLFYYAPIYDNTTTTYIDTGTHSSELNGGMLLYHPPLSVLAGAQQNVISELEDLDPYFYEVNFIASDNVPNLFPFISHTTDINYMNNKGISDLNDFIFNKSFIMMSNNTNNETFNDYNNLINSFTTPNLYFYNIDFKIDKTSEILLNDKIVNYLLPLSTQQFFYKTNDDDYFNIENNQLVTMQPDQISELYFNPSFDEINIFPSFLINNKYYANVMIDLIINNLELIITQNKDYKTITELIDNINNKFINTFSNYLNVNKLYGNMTQQILSWTDELNKINIFDTFISLSITKYNNDNYFNYTHAAFRYIKDSITNYQPASSTVKFSKLPADYLINIKILSPIFTKYSSNNKISINLYNYLLSISSFYTEHIKYINDNVTFLNIMNPNIYIDKYFPNNLITNKINNTFYDNINNEIYTQILYPFIDINVDKIIINDIELIDFVIDRSATTNNYIYLNNNIRDIKITTNTIIDNKIENLNYDTIQKSINRTTFLSNKFNNIGIFYINENHKIEITDKYSINNNSIKLYKFDDNKIYRVINNKLYTNNEGFNIILLKNFMVINPYEITFNNKTDKTITLLKDNTNIEIPHILSIDDYCDNSMNVDTKCTYKLKGISSKRY
jgi:hypothetical protein